MNTFRNFVECLNRKPDKIYAGNKEAGWQAKQDILKHLEDTKFVINNSNPDNIIVHAERSLNDSISPPFKTLWIQSPENTTLTITVGAGRKEECCGIFLHEFEPYRYIFCISMVDQINPLMERFRFGILNVLAERELTDEYIIISAFLLPFSKNYHLGTVKTNDRVKFRNSIGEKTLFKIKKVVHVFSGTKKAKIEAEKQFLNIEWSHQWAVRGHWRTLKGIGKNRQGEYGVNGFTWVEDHIKGPEDKPLIQKTRIVHDEMRGLCPNDSVLEAKK